MNKYTHTYYAIILSAPSFVLYTLNFFHLIFFFFNFIFAFFLTSLCWLEAGGADGATANRSLSSVHIFSIGILVMCIYPYGFQGLIYLSFHISRFLHSQCIIVSEDLHPVSTYVCIYLYRADL